MYGSFGGLGHEYGTPYYPSAYAGGSSYPTYQPTSFTPSSATASTESAQSQMSPSRGHMNGTRKSDLEGAENNDELPPALEKEKKSQKDSGREPEQPHSQKETENKGKARQKKESKEKDDKATVIDKHIRKLEDNIDLLIEYYDQYKELHNVKSFFASEEVPDFGLKVKGIQDITTTLKMATKNLKEIIKAMSNESQAERSRVEKDVTALLDKVTKVFDPIAKDIQDIENSQASLKIEPLKRFFYLDDQTQKEELLKSTPEEFHQFITQHDAAIAAGTSPQLSLITKEWNEFNETFKKDFQNLFPPKRRGR